MEIYKNVDKNIIESLISIFTVIDGDVKVLLFRKQTEPYRGYWMLPGYILKNNEDVETSTQKYVLDNCGFDDLYIEHCNLFSNVERIPNYRVIATTSVGFIDGISVEIKQDIPDNIESEWFSISAIPKTVFDHGDIIENSISFLRDKIVKSNILKKFFPSDFTLPELQKVYEQILNVELDRRNFRKKLINFDLIEDTGYRNEGYTGRPAKLYRFKEDIENIKLF